ncbi:Clr5 domain-containing protein [Thelonectria olida]|uniref:Clr5 domain-containing protein n=1 Tax=Thelonectria olida TaxID=1576542 RepID=A0A9P9AMS6_9HYPO|nr:Clr5 domain-containing protein [Thelonectria olida]
MSLVSSSAPGPSKPSQGPGAAEWNAHQATLTKLYLRQGKTLTEIVDIMAQKYNFHANERMFKFRFKRWKIDKNLTSNEAIAMARVQARREARGADSEFWRHGRPFTAMQLERYLRNHPHVVTQLKKHVPQDLLRKGRIEELLPSHIVVLTPSPSLIGDASLHSLEGVVLTVRDYINSYTAEDWDHLNRLALFDSEVADEVNGQPKFMDWTQVPPEATKYLLDDHFNWLQNDMSKRKPNFICTLVYYAAARSEHPEFAQMWLRHARDSSVAIKGRTHPLSVAFSEIFERFYSTGEHSEQSICTLIDVVYASFSATVGEDHEITLDLMDNLCSIMDNLTITSGAHKYTNSVMLERWMAKLEAESNAETALWWVSTLARYVEPEHAKLALDWLARHPWQEFLSVHYSSKLSIAFAYQKVGDAQSCFNMCWDVLETLSKNWEGTRALSHHVNDELENLWIMACLIELLEKLPEDMGEIHSLMDRAQAWRCFFQDAVLNGITYQTPLQLDD